METTGSAECSANDFVAKARADLEARREATKARLAEKYGCKDTAEFAIAFEVESDRDYCARCIGLPCYSTKKKYATPCLVRRDGELVKEYEPCRYAAEHERQLRQSLLKTAAIPKRYAFKTYADYVEDEDNYLAVKYAKNSLRLNCGAWFHGEYGTGKTFLASLIALDWLAAKRSVIFIKVPALLDELRATFDGQNTREAAIMEKVKNVDLLVLDDFGQEKPTRFAGTTLCKIIDARYDGELATIITSNYKAKEVAQFLDNASDGKNLNGSRIADRCNELCRPIYFGGKSRRC